ncbi:MAG: ribosomal L7Ae/L30e/S12e/Gadd45 family protein [Clostridia bacterium]|nr:ribosomal L7Ae/L30e/S12e/Gadd45 family protein [Clostridia bacterium]
MEELKAAAKKAVGTKAVLRALKAGEAVRVYVANDVDTFLYQKIVRAVEEAGMRPVRVESVKELGRACGLTIGCAAAATLR